MIEWCVHNQTLILKNNQLNFKVIKYVKDLEKAKMLKYAILNHKGFYMV